MPSIRARLIGVAPFCVSVALVLCSCGGGGETRTDEGPPPATVEGKTDAVPRALQHAELQQIEDQVQEALFGTPDSPNQPNYAVVLDGAKKLGAGSDAILKDAPATLKDEDHLRYESLAAQLKERASALEGAAQASNPLQARRSFLQITASCVKCHNGFGSQGSK